MDILLGLILTGALLLVGGVVAAIVLIAAFLFISPALKDRLTFSPNESGFFMFLEVREGTASCIIRGGEPIYTLTNNENGTFIRVFGHGEEGTLEDTEDSERKRVKLSDFLKEDGKSWRKPWRMYQQWIYDTTGLIPYVPFFTEPVTYSLPRLKELESLKEGSGDEVRFERVKDLTYFINHQIFTWYFLYRSVDIQKIPFTVMGSAQVSIDENKIREALFQTKSWNILLDMALKAVVRSKLRSQISVDVALGVVGEDLKAEGDVQDLNFNSKTSDNDLLKADRFSRLGTVITEGILDYEMQYQDGRRKLKDFGVIVGRVDINDLTDELSPADRAKFFAAAIGREEGRAIALRGKGEAEAAESLYAALQAAGGGTLAETIIKSNAFADGLRGSNGVQGLAAALTQRIQ